MSISLSQVFEIYRDTIDGIKQQTLAAEFAEAMRSYPRDYVVVARGIEAAFGFEVEFYFPDFYRERNIPDGRKDFFSFYEYAYQNKISIYLNTHKFEDGRPLLPSAARRFVVLKEIFNAVVRKASLARDLKYPDTVEFASFYSALLDWCVEPFSVYDFGDAGYSPTVSFENAAELLALMFTMDIGELYNARRALRVPPKEVWDIQNGSRRPSAPAVDNPELQFALFNYRDFAEKYGLSVRHVVLFVKTDFILKVVDGLKQVVPDVRDYIEGVIVALFDHFVALMRKWSSNSGIAISEDAQKELEILFRDADSRIDFDTAASRDANGNLVSLLEEARRNAAANIIDLSALRSALKSLCPLFPFC
jgi:hypothetical protein